MSRIVYVNGRYLPYGEAGVHVEDRGFQLADGVYEVFEVRGGRLVDESRHMARLGRSLDALSISRPMSARALGHVMRETVRRNHVSDGMVYLQVTRGEARRDFVFPDPAPQPTIVVIARRMDLTKANARVEKGIAVVSRPDIRWGRCDLKTTMLLPAALAKQSALEAGAQEVWFVDREGYVTEGGSSNAWIVTTAGTVVTRATDNHILGGVTRLTVLDLLAAEGVPVEIRPFKLSEATSAREAFITAATQIVMPVVRIDGQVVGSGEPGPVARHLRNNFHSKAEIA
ncbi:MAG: D-amino-acid transaminase [Hyphomicrobium sp.]|nr:D-amino-acid transaminase [Hyphomicrobium sp.]